VRRWSSCITSCRCGPCRASSSAAPSASRKGLLRRTVTERFGTSPPIGRATEIARILEEQLYPDHGYLRADIRAVTVDDPRDAASTVLVFEVDAGPRARIADVQLSGQPVDAPAFLRRLGAVSGAPYEPLRLTDEINKYVEDLRRAGRYEANASYRPIMSEDGTRVGLTIDVEPGPLVTLRFEGDTLPQDRIDELVPLRREASAHQDLLEDSEQRIRAYLAQQGYWRAAVTHRVEDDGTGGSSCSPSRAVSNTGSRRACRSPATVPCCTRSCDRCCRASRPGTSSWRPTSMPRSPRSKACTLAGASPRCRWTRPPTKRIRPRAASGRCGPPSSSPKDRRPSSAT
jgi:hypothetical protein